ncbi:MAG: hypothetical protein JJE52_17315 [Acidimicrobiia bacterium]|nr:hypothetical protein [Acidimicrobiia bacterium]
MNPNLYQVTATPSGKWWAITVDDLPGVFAQAASFRAVEDAAKEAIGLYLDIDPAEVLAVVTPNVGEELDRRIRQRQRRVHELQQMQVEVATESRQTAQDLIDAGLTQRDVAQLLGVSFQRISQLVGD